VHQVTWAIVNLYYYVIYHIEHPFFEQYKVHDQEWPWKENRKEWNRVLWQATKLLLINHLLVVPIMGSPNYFKGRHFKMDYEELPSLPELYFQLFFYALMEDISFYWGHRIFHWKKIYPYIHKYHHEHRNTVGISSESSHPIEFIFANIIPANLGGIILGRERIHLVTFTLWVVMKTVIATDTHSGYEFPWNPHRWIPFKTSSEHHNYHHLLFTGNFSGFFNFWDNLCGTNNKRFLLIKEKQKLQAEERLKKEQPVERLKNE
jgi:methylsterol monooxygenase